MALPTETVNAVLNILCQASQERSEELLKFCGKNLIQDSDEKKQCENPLYKSVL